MRMPRRRLRDRIRPESVCDRRQPGAGQGGLRILKFPLAMALACVLCVPAVCDNKVAEPAITPVQAELIAGVHARRLKVGATVFARVIVDWTSADCVLRTGAILEARVVSVTPYTKGAGVSEIDLAFTRAQCGRPQLGDFDLLLAALAAPPRNTDLGILSDPLPLNTGNGGRPATVEEMQRNVNYNLNRTLGRAVSDSPAIPNLHIGDISGIRGLRLNVGAGADHSSVLTWKGHDVALEKHTLLLLVPAHGAYPRTETRSDPEAKSDPDRPAPDLSPAGSSVLTERPPATTASLPGSGSPATTAGSPATTALPPVNDIDLCDPAHCNVALPGGEEAGSRKPAATISLQHLGYATRSRRATRDVDNDEALAWLGPRELLVAFNPHGLITRQSLGPSGFTQRVIRAALLDTETRQVIRTVDWELPDTREYLWPLADNRVLVHVASDLRVYGTGLKIWKRIPLDGPLAFARVTPDGSFIAVGVVRERHSPELHAALSQDLQNDPEEDVDVMVLNRDFETIARSNARTGFMPPTLLNEGQASLLAQPNMRYRLAMRSWDSAASTLARFNSSCVPELSSFAPDLIFLVSCNLQNGLREYRVLHSNGKMTLKGSSNQSQCVQGAKGNAADGIFVVKTLCSDVPLLPEESSSEEFFSEDLNVYRASDGKQLLGLRVGFPSFSRDAYALAADSSELAVLTRGQVSIYPINPK
jgi:hypothetical protein